MAFCVKRLCASIIVLCAITELSYSADSHTVLAKENNSSSPTPTQPVMTTSPPAINTTTHAMNTTTAGPIPTTTPAPPNYWFVRNNGTVCILMNATINITTGHSSEIVPFAHNGSTSSGTCGSVEKITIHFNNNKNNLTFTFKPQSDTRRHSLTEVDYYNGTRQFSANTTDFWANKNGMLATSAYSCSAVQTLLHESDVKITVADMKLEVFRSSNSTQFNDSEQKCAADTKVSNLVPIIVGAALGGLILIVLIAYLIGRKRSRHGYEQV